MKKQLLIMIALIFGFTSWAQIDRDQLSLDISKADATNMEKLKSYIWKKESVVSIDGEEKMDMLSEISVNSDNSVNITTIDSHSDVKQKRGIRGKIQHSSAENNAEYMEGAVKHAMAYMYMSKGQLLDFFSMAEITENDGILIAVGSDVLVKGDKLTLQVDKKSKLFLYKKFESTMGEDPVSGEINYAKFKSGVTHVSTGTLNLPAKKAVIQSTNRDYVQKVL